MTGKTALMQINGGDYSERGDRAEPTFSTTIFAARVWHEADIGRDALECPISGAKQTFRKVTDICF